MKRELGICMAGLEEAIESYVRLVASRFRHVRYLEIGVASGQTLVGVTDIMRECARLWTSFGVDLPDGYSLERNAILQRANALGIPAMIIEMNDSMLSVFPRNNHITVFLKAAQPFIETNLDQPSETVDLALIDGCHGKDCVEKEFYLLEKKVPTGGIVMCHDFGQDSVGEPQPHCGTGDALGACRALGLLDGSRKGWKHLATVIGDKERNGRDLGVFERL